MENAGWMKQSHRGSYNQVAKFPWVKDGLTVQEAKTAENLFYIAASNHGSLESLLALGWLSDDLSVEEDKAVRWIKALNFHDQDVAKRVMGMPFLASVDSTDALLLEGLYYQEYKGTLDNILGHPRATQGIADEDAVLFTAVTTIHDREQVNRFLAPKSATVETIRTSSARTPNLTISIVRAGERRATNTSLIIEEAVGYVENAMGRALPTDHVILLLDDTGVTQNFAGVNYGQAIAYLREGEDGDEWERAAFTKGIAHEVAHYFWHGNENWIDEGMADTIEQNYGRDKGLPPQMMVTERKGCTVTTLQALSEMAPEQQNKQFQCNYYLGERLFLDLQNALGREEFSSRARQLYEITKPLREENEKAGAGGNPAGVRRPSARGREALDRKGTRSNPNDRPGPRGQRRGSSNWHTRSLQSVPG